MFRKKKREEKINELEHKISKNMPLLKNALIEVKQLGLDPEDMEQGHLKVMASWLTELHQLTGGNKGKQYSAEKGYKQLYEDISNVQPGQQQQSSNSNSNKDNSDREKDIIETNEYKAASNFEKIKMIADFEKAKYREKVNNNAQQSSNSNSNSNSNNNNKSKNIDYPDMEMKSPEGVAAGGNVGSENYKQLHKKGSSSRGTAVEKQTMENVGTPSPPKTKEKKSSNHKRHKNGSHNRDKPKLSEVYEALQEKRRSRQGHSQPVRRRGQATGMSNAAKQKLADARGKVKKKSNIFANYKPKK